MTHCKELSFYFIAGEPSGDIIGAKVIKELKLLSSSKDLRFYGVGGSAMSQEGLSSLFDIRQISIMGFIEVISRIFQLRRLINDTVQDIIYKKPNIVVTIDSPGFCFRVAKKLKKLSLDIKIVHIVAPTVWIYKSGRAKKFASVYDHLFALFDFEPPYFEQEGLKTTFVGHPIFEQEFRGGGEFRTKYNIDNDVMMLLVTPGSRMIELERHLDIFIQTTNMLSMDYNKFVACFVAIDDHEPYIKKALSSASFPYLVISNELRLGAFAAADIALAKSGTNTIEIAASMTPMIVGYKLNKLTYILIKALAKIKYASLINIIAKKTIIPEFIQDNCNPNALYHALKNLLDHKTNITSQVSDSLNILKKMGLGRDKKPSRKIAEVIMSLL